ncbi:MAG: phosphotransferase, partial [Nocardioidaceae bacterium]
GLVRGLLPVPEVLEVRRARPAAGVPALLVTSCLPGDRLDVVLPRLAPVARGRLGERIGLLVGRLAMMPLPARGRFVDPGLRVEPISGDPDGQGGLVEVVERLLDGPGRGDWSAADTRALAAVAQDAQAVLDGVTRACLVHGDLVGSNLLLDTDRLEVTGLVDWEHAHAGAPGVDLGSLLRHHRDRTLTAAVLAGYRATVVDAAGLTDLDLLDRARAADLAVLVRAAARPGPVAGDVRDLLLAVARGGDLHAVP